MQSVRQAVEQQRRVDPPPSMPYPGPPPCSHPSPFCSLLCYPGRCHALAPGDMHSSLGNFNKNVHLSVIPPSIPLVVLLSVHLSPYSLSFFHSLLPFLCPFMHLCIFCSLPFSLSRFFAPSLSPSYLLSSSHSIPLSFPPSSDLFSYPFIAPYFLSSLSLPICHSLFLSASSSLRL